RCDIAGNDNNYAYPHNRLRDTDAKTCPERRKPSPLSEPLVVYQLAAEAVIGRSRGVLEGVERCFKFVFCHLREKHIERARGHRDPDNHEDIKEHTTRRVS